MPAIKHFRDLEVYQAAYKLALVVHRETGNLKDFALVKEIMRSARSIATNIAEGFARKSDYKIFNYHLGVAIGEANEMVVHLDFLRDTAGLNGSVSEGLSNQYEILAKKLNVLRSQNIKRNSPRSKIENLTSNP